MPVIWGALLASMVGVSGIVGDRTIPALSPSATVEIISADHRVEFPDRIVLTVEIESTYEVQEVQLFYRLGQLETTIYGYPTISRASGTLMAEFEILTSGGAFIPEGVRIEYYYQFRDIRGERFESDRFHLDYLDPQYDWRRLDAGIFELLWHNRPREAVEEVAREVRLGLEAVSDLLGQSPSHKMRAVILNGRREANRAFPLVSQAATESHLYGGFAYPDYDVFVLSGLNVDGMIHEMTHLLIGDAIDSPVARVPAWLNEGLAMYFEGGPGDRSATVSDASRSGRLMTLRNMGAVPGRPSDVRVFYAQSWSIVSFAAETFGLEGMSRLLSAIDSGQGTEEAIRTAYGISLDELEARWRGSIENDTSITQIVDPGTLGTSLLIAAAMLIAATALAVGWLRRDRSVPDYDE